MFIPLHDDTPLRVIRFQWVTLALLVLNVGIFLFSGAFRGDAIQAALADGFGVVPAEMFKTFAGAPHIGPDQKSLFLPNCWRPCPDSSH